MINRFISTGYQSNSRPNIQIGSIARLRSMQSAFRLFLLTSCFIVPLPVIAAAISVTVDRNPITINESLQFVFSAAEKPDGDPNFDPLEKDFDIINQNRSSNVSIINGSISKSYTWTLNVMPKRTGTLPIPSIAFGNDNSQASSVVVKAADNANTDTPGTGQDLFLQVSATPEDPYVQSQAIYTLKLFHKVGIAQASLTEPELENAVVEKLGDDKNFNAQFNGENYTVTERRYAIFPQQSGSMTIAPLTLTAEVITGQRSRFDGFFGTRATRTQRVTSNSVDLNVRPVPDAFTGSYWLPAEGLTLKQQWSGDTDDLKVGEPLTRTLTLTAIGATVSGLPELNNINGVIRSNQQGELKNYPDQPTLKELQKGESVVALREEKIAFIPSKAGVYHLPAIEIPWWNTETGKMELAQIPAQTLTAIGLEPAPTEAPAASASTPQAVAPEPPQRPSPTVQQPADNIWLWISAFLACGWLVTLILLIIKLRPKKPATQPAPQPDRSQAELKQACRNNDALAAKNALIQWGRKRFNASNLAKIAESCTPPLQEQILQLNRHLYDPHADVWNGGEQLLRAFNNNKTVSQRTREDQILEPLYKF